MNNIPKGLCQCGCGLKTTISPYNVPSRGYVKGMPRKFRSGHNSKLGVWNYNGGTTTNTGGYVLVEKPNHPNARKDGKISEHILIVEKIIGKYLPPMAIVHHVNKKTNDNRPCNLVLCESQAYHSLLHARERAFAACGHANWVKCVVCHKYDHPKNLYLGESRKWARHKSCHARYEHMQRKKRNQ